MLRRMFPVGVVALTVSVGLWAQQSNPLPVNWTELPAPFATESARNGPALVPRPAGAQLSAPPGFTVEPFLTGLNRPRYMILGPGNEILLSETARDGGVSVIKESR